MPAKLETLIDAFDADNFSANWIPFVFGGAKLILNNKRVEMSYPAASTSATDGDLVSATTYDLTGSYAFFQVQAVPNPGTLADAEIRIKIDATNWFRWIYEGGTLIAQYMKAGSKNNIASFTYDPGQHRWWKISESGGVITWWTSSDGKTFTSQGTFTHGMTITAVSLLLAGTCFQNEVSPGSFYFDNCNIIPTPAPAVIGYVDNRISYTPKSKYQFLAYVNGQFFADLTGIADNRQFVTSRNDPDSIHFDCSIDKINTLCKTLNINMSDLFQSCITEVRVARYGTVITAGELGVWDGNVGGDRRAKFTASGWFELMKSRRVTTTYTGQTGLFIAKDLFANTLARQYGSNGNYSGLVLGNTPSVDNTTVYPLQQYDDKTIFDALKDMSNEPNGFDFEFTWDKRFNIYHPAIGVVRSDVIFSYPFGNVKDIIYSVDPTKIVNTLAGDGKGAVGDKLTVSLSDAVTAQRYGIRDDRVNYPNVTDLTQLTNLTQAHLNVHKNPLVINQIKYDGSGRVNAPQVGELHVGDQVRISVSNLNLFKDINKYYIIDRITVALGQADEEDVTLNVSDPSLAKNG